jgi:hypothetical protein
VVASGAREHQIAVVTVGDRAPVRFDFLATGRENGGPTEVIDNHYYLLWPAFICRYSLAHTWCDLTLDGVHKPCTGVLYLHPKARFT